MQRESIRVLAALLAYSIVVALCLALLVWFSKQVSESTWLNPLSVVGSLTGIFGVAITVYQTYRARTAAEAAQRSAENTAASLAQRAYRSTLLSAQNCLTEAYLFSFQRQWQLAGLRTDDLARHVSNLVNQGKIRDARWNKFLRILKTWSEFFRSIRLYRGYSRVNNRSRITPSPRSVLAGLWAPLTIPANVQRMEAPLQEAAALVCRAARQPT